MPIEIERKFLIKEGFIDEIKSKCDYYTTISQGYLGASSATSTTRIRLEGSSVAKLTIKGEISAITRSEFEYDIPTEHAAYMLNTMCSRAPIEKTRYVVKYFKPNYYELPDTDSWYHTWEIDVFSGINDGLIVAEIELSSEDEKFAIPKWLGTEVTMDTRYLNVKLYETPYILWNAMDL